MMIDGSNVPAIAVIYGKLSTLTRTSQEPDVDWSQSCCSAARDEIDCELPRDFGDDAQQKTHQTKLN
jgi:hypothetical protein